VLVPKRCSYLFPEDYTTQPLRARRIVSRNLSICTVIKTTSVGDAGAARRAWSTRLAAATLSGRGARVYTCTCVHDNVPCRRLPKYAAHLYSPQALGYGVAKVVGAPGLGAF